MLYARKRGAMFRHSALCATIVSVQGIATAAAEPPSAAGLSSCQLPGLTQPARCGVFDLPENPDRPDGRKLPINVVVIPATGGRALADPIVQAACKDWPKVSLPAELKTPLRSSVPTLFVSGDSDAGTPLWFTERVARGFSNRLEVVLGGRGHTQWSDCIGPLYEQFVRSGTARGLDASACTPVPRPPFKTR